MMGEIGGNAEEQAAESQEVGRVHQAGRRVHRRPDRPAGQADGPRRRDHLGRLGQGADKIAALEGAGIRVAKSPADMGVSPPGRAEGLSLDPHLTQRSRTGEEHAVTDPSLDSFLRDHDPVATDEPLDDPEPPPVYENPWIAVREDQVLRPDGQPGIYGVVHFKNRAVGVLPVDEQGRSGSSASTAITLDAYSWEIPEGGGPRGRDARGDRPPRAPRGDRPDRGPARAHLRTSHLSNSVSDELGLHLPRHRA